MGMHEKQVMHMARQGAGTALHVSISCCTAHTRMFIMQQPSCSSLHQWLTTLCTSLFNLLSWLCTGNICIYCPGGPDSDFEYSTQSYTGYEPTSMRAIRARYNPYVQVGVPFKPAQIQGTDPILGQACIRQNCWKPCGAAHSCQSGTLHLPDLSLVPKTAASMS